MPTLSELKKLLISAQNKRPKIKSFFGPMLNERVKRPNWLENGLVLLLLRDAHSRLEMIEGFIEKAESESGELLQSMCREYKGSEPDFDARLNDLLAELNALTWLVNNNYREIEKLPRGDGKTPDFKARKETDCLFEVKCFQTPSELLDIVVKGLEIQFLLKPERYSTQFQVEVSAKTSRKDFLDDTDKLNACRLIAIIDDKIQSGELEAQLSYKKSVGDRQVTRNLKCKWGKGQGFGFIGHSGDFAVCLSDPKRPLRLLLPLIRKSWERTEYAVDQLMEYDMDDSCDKWILINWQKPPDFVFDDALSQKYRDSIPLVDSILKQLNPKLHIHLL